LSEVERLGAGRLEALAERINAEHRAYDKAMKAAAGQLNAALDHALEAGALLTEAKEQCPHGTWLPWLEANFAGSPRRAQEYMFLARNRADLEDLKARDPALSGIQGALEVLRIVHRLARNEQPPGPPPVPGTTPLNPAQERLQKLREREVQRLLPWAEYSLRMGTPHLMAGPKTTPEGWGRAIERALEVRREHLPNKVDALAHGLRILSDTVTPESVARYLVEPTGDVDAAEAHSDMLEELREGVAWLERVLEEAEAARGVRR
jgi:hypothetical protein